MDVNKNKDVASKMPEVRVIRLKKCKVATSGEPDTSFTKVFNFPLWWEGYDKNRRATSYAPLDFLFGENGGLVWWMMVEDEATPEQCGGYEVIDFEGGLYAVHTSIDEDMESQSLVEQKVKNWIKNTGFELDDSNKNRTFLGHMINPDEDVKQGLGYNQYEIFVPIRLKC